MISAWEALQELAAWQVMAIPRRPQPKRQVTSEDDGDQDWDQYLAESLNSFKDCSWPLMYLRSGADAG